MHAACCVACTSVCAGSDGDEALDIYNCTDTQRQRQRDGDQQTNTDTGTHTQNCTNTHTCRQLRSQTHGQANGTATDRQDRQTETRTNRQTDKYTSSCCISRQSGSISKTLRASVSVIHYCSVRTCNTCRWLFPPLHSIISILWPAYQCACPRSCPRDSQGMFRAIQGRTLAFALIPSTGASNNRDKLL